MLKCILTVGAPASGKSFWAKSEVAKDPSNWVRVNNDDIRAMCNGSVWSSGYEKFVTSARNFLIEEALRRNKNLIIDNVNANRRHFETVCKLIQQANVDAQVFEKPFYEELEVLLERDSKREGTARVGEMVVKKWWKDLGGKGFKFYNPRNEIFNKRAENIATGPIWNDALPAAIICDLDGTFALIRGRSPYDASDCDIKDLPNIPVIETVLAHYHSGRKIIFCSGREDKYRPETIRFIEKHCRNICSHNDCDNVGCDLGVMPYELHMRKTGDFRKDSVIKEEIYEGNILGKYNVLLVLDDRTSVIKFWRSKGLTCFQVAPGDF
jgi:predicted kinase